jgi:phospholipid-transporting ATPase
MLCLSLCHTTMTQTLNNEIVYNASSPDELALVNMAKICGYRFIGTDDDNNMTIHIYDDPLNP